MKSTSNVPHVTKGWPGRVTEQTQGKGCPLRQRYRFTVRAVASAIALMGLAARALDRPESPAPGAAMNPFFAMHTIARGSPSEVVPMLKELGFDGLGGAAGDDAMATALESAGMRFFNGYLALQVHSGQPMLDERLRGIVDRMAAHRSVLWLAVMKVHDAGGPLPKSSVGGDAIALTGLRELSDYAHPRGVRIALYPHVGAWLERVEDALRLAEKLGRDDVGVTFNLCHWLKVEGSGRDPLPVLRAALPRLMFVTIHGADTGDTQKMGWERLIQPLGSGSYDVSALLGKIRAAGYTGPIGFQGFGIRQESRAVLAQTMVAWRKMNAPATKAPFTVSPE